MIAEKGINAHLREITEKSRQITVLTGEIARLEVCLLTNHGEVTANLMKAIDMAKEGMSVIAEEQKSDNRTSNRNDTPDRFSVD